MQKHYLGIILDLSKDMKNSTTYLAEKFSNKYEYIIEILQDELEKLKLLDSIQANKTELYISFLVFGVHSYYIQKRKNKYRLKHKIGFKERGIWDLVSLYENIKKFQKLEGIEKELDSLWQEKSKNGIKKIKSNIDLNSKDLLETFIITEISKTANKNIINTLYRLGEKLFYKLNQKIQKNYTQEKYNQIKSRNDNVDRKIEQKIILVPREYTSLIENITHSIYNSNLDKYRNIINEYINSIVKQHAKTIVERADVSNDWSFILQDYKKSLEQFEKIKNKLFNKLEKCIKSDFNERKKDIKDFLKSNLNSTGANIYSHQLFKYTYKYIQYLSYNYLEPFFRETLEKRFKADIQNLVKDTLVYYKERINNPQYLNIKEIGFDKQLQNLINRKELFHWSDYFQDVLSFLLPAYDNPKFIHTKKYLLIISNGGFYKNQYSKYEREILEYIDKEITIISALITDGEIVMDDFIPTKEIQNYYGYQFLYKYSTPLNKLPELKQKLIENGYKIDENSKLCFQVNHPEILNMVLNSVFI